MPAYNASAFIAESIESVLAQTYTNWELIVIDDGSTDSTAEIAKEKAAHDCRIQYLHQENGKQAKARNLGLLQAKGELVAFLDADDLWLNNKLYVMVKEFMLGNQDLLFSDCYVFEDCFKIDEAKRKGVIAAEYHGFEGLSIFLDVNRIPMPTVICKSEILKKYKFNELMVPAEDYELWLRMLRDGCTLRAISLPLSAYRYHVTSSTANDRYVTDTVINIIFALKSPSNDISINNLIDQKLSSWLCRKLRSVENDKQLIDFILLLRSMNIPINTKMIGIINFVRSKLFNINKRLISIILK
jgi:glycosyltransferase involved in cell wall biosynthesis